MIGLLALAMILTTAAPATPATDQPKPGVTADAPPPAGSLAIARRIVGKMRVEEQQRFALSKVAPLFAASVLAMAADRMPDEVKAALQTPGGTERVARILSEEYIAAFEARLPQLSAAMAAQLAKDLPLADLQSIDAFLDTPAGRKWSSELPLLQQASSEAGRRAGEAAGKAAAAATIQRLRGMGTGS
jgi:hypothetical protein